MQVSARFSECFKAVQQQISMSHRFDPRGDLSMPILQGASHYHRPESTSSRYNDKRASYGVPPAAYPKKKPCQDWIFSSASNVHIAVDRSSFKDYIPFKSYVLTVSHQRQVPVKGIGSVELKIRRRPTSRESHKILLENVLHVPGWLCNIVSDVHFFPAGSFEHEWTDYGVSFQHKSGEKWKSWGYTEPFCGLDKLVLARNPQGRSPMLEDKEREVFSVNVMWPQSQRDKWDHFVAEEERREAEVYKTRMKLAAEKKELNGMRRDYRSGLNGALQSVVSLKKSLPDLSSVASTPVRKALADVDSNPKRAASVQAGSLKTSNSKATFLEALPWRKSWAAEAR